MFPIGTRVWCVVPDGPVDQWTRGNVDHYSTCEDGTPIVYVSCGTFPDNHAVPFLPSQLQVLP